MRSPRIVTKIVQPSKSPHLLHRSRLVDFLQAHIHRKLIIISASAGYGKTSLLADFAQETTWPVCWYSLDPSDRDPHVFLDYLIATIQRRFPKVRDSAHTILASDIASSDLDASLDALVSDIQEAIPGPFVIILDDYHTVADSEPINRIVNTFLLTLPEKVHLIVASRTLPVGLRLTHLAVRQEVAGLGMSELQFTAEEIRALISQNYQIELSMSQVNELADRSEGWIAGILLTTPALWHGLFPRLVQGENTRENIFRFLANETFVHLSPDLQRFLLASSVLNRLDAATCDELLGIKNSAELLRSIEDQNLFIVRLDNDAHGSSYRYHHLFLEFLRQRLVNSDPSCWHDLNQRAAELFESERQFPDQAITHYLAAGMHADAARVMESVAQSSLDGEHSASLSVWIDALPAESLDMHPNLIVARALGYADAGDNQAAETAYGQAIKIYEAQGDSVSAARATVWRAVLWRQEGRYSDAIQACEQVLPTLHNVAHRAEAQAYRIIGSTHALLGPSPQCVNELGQSLRLYETLRDEVGVAWLHHDIGTCLQFLGDPMADSHYQRALGYWRETRNAVGMAMTLNSIGVGYHRAGQYAQATQTLEEARTLAHQTGNQRNEAFALTSLGDVYRDQGELSRALDLYRQAADAGGPFDGFIVAYTLIAQGEAYRLSGDQENARHWIQQALELAESHRSCYETGLAETAMGIWEYLRNEVEDAEVHLQKAVDLLQTAPRDCARARLHLARAYLLAGKHDKAKQQLRAVSGLAKAWEPTSIPFIVADRKLLLPLLEYAATKKIGEAYFSRVLARWRAMDAQVTSATQPKVQVRAFGTTHVVVADKAIARADWGTNSTKELFFLLLANPEGLRKEQILETLWEGKPAAEASVLFHSTAYRLRRVIPGGIVYKNGQYSLKRDINFQYDVARFDELVHDAVATRDEGLRLEKYEQAITLYRGDYFEESYSDWSGEIRGRLLRKYLDALLSLAESCERRGDTARAMRYYQILIDKDRDREDIYRALMRLQYRIGDRAGAARTYRRCSQVLRDELNIPSPSRETRALYSKIVEEAGDALAMLEEAPS